MRVAGPVAVTARGSLCGADLKPQGHLKVTMQSQVEKLGLCYSDAA